MVSAPSKSSEPNRLATETVERAAAIDDPVEKLRFLREALTSRSARQTRLRAVVYAFCALLATGVALAVHQFSQPTKLESVARLQPAPVAPRTEVARVWLVERRGSTDFYSNGLRVERGFERSTSTRSYIAIRRQGRERFRRTDPAGVVFHTTESELSPFEPSYNQSLKANSLGLLAYVQQRALYHFVIDRFGRVHRIVAESDYANHAGNSVWADREFIYVGLNRPFLGVSFEGRTAEIPSQPIAAQVAAGRQLVEMLRSTYGIPLENFVTHAQVSVNPENMQIGYHTDWATNFPFVQLGLADGYAALSPAVVLFGFNYSQDLIHRLGGKPSPGLVLSEQQLIKDAADQGRTQAAYRRLLQREYREIAAALRAGASAAKGDRYE